MDLPPSLGLLLHPDKPWPCFKLHHHRCYAKPDRNGETDSKKGNPHGRVPAVLKCGIERAEGTLVPADEPGEAHVAPHTRLDGDCRGTSQRPKRFRIWKFRPPAPTRRTPRRIAKRRTQKGRSWKRGRPSRVKLRRIWAAGSAVPPWNHSADSKILCGRTGNPGEGVP